MNAYPILYFFFLFLQKKNLVFKPDRYFSLTIDEYVCVLDLGKTKLTLDID